MKILVYGSTREIAFYKLQNLLDDMRYGDVNKVYKSNFDFVVKLKNGDIFQAVTASDSARGHAYIDMNIDSEIIQQIILPCYIGFNITGQYEFY